MSPRPDNPRVYVPPPLIIVGTLLLGLAIDGRLRAFPVSLDAWAWVGAPIAALGIALVGASLGLFRRAGTRAEPWQPASALVQAGLYRYTRNPMYLGMLVTYAGIAIGLRSPAAGLLLVPLFAVMDRGVVAREEAYLLRRFGADFERYRSEVRRWF